MPAAEPLRAPLRPPPPRRRQWLLAQSRAWIGADALEARVEEALENPVPLYAHTNARPQR